MNRGSLLSHWFTRCCYTGVCVVCPLIWFCFFFWGFPLYYKGTKSTKAKIKIVTYFIDLLVEIICGGNSQKQFSWSKWKTLVSQWGFPILTPLTRSSLKSHKKICDNIKHNIKSVCVCVWPCEQIRSRSCWSLTECLWSYPLFWTTPVCHIPNRPTGLWWVMREKLLLFVLRLLYILWGA